MYIIITDMEKPKDVYGDDFCVIVHCDAKDCIETIYSELIFYYSFYNKKHVKVATFKDYDFTKSNEYKLLKKVSTKKLSNIRRLFNPGNKEIDFNNLIEYTVPLKDRLCNAEDLKERISKYKNNKWFNELNWETDI